MEQAGWQFSSLLESRRLRLLLAGAAGIGALSWLLAAAAWFALSGEGATTSADLLKAAAWLWWLATTAAFVGLAVATWEALLDRSRLQLALWRGAAVVGAFVLALGDLLGVASGSHWYGPGFGPSGTVSLALAVWAALLAVAALRRAGLGGGAVGEAGCPRGGHGFEPWRGQLRCRLHRGGASRGDPWRSHPGDRRRPVLGDRVWACSLHAPARRAARRRAAGNGLSACRAAACRPCRAWLRRCNPLCGGRGRHAHRLPGGLWGAGSVVCRRPVDACLGGGGKRRRRGSAKPWGSRRAFPCRGRGGQPRGLPAVWSLRTAGGGGRPVLPGVWAGDLVAV